MKSVSRDNNEEPGIGIVTFPSGRAGIIPISNLIDIMIEIYGHAHLITGNDAFEQFGSDERISISSIFHLTGKTMLRRILNYAITQIRITIEFLKVRGNSTSWIFFLGGGSLFIPILFARMAKKKAILVLTSEPWKTNEYKSESMSRWVELLSKLTCMISSAIIVYSSNLISDWKLDSFRNKILIAPRHFVDFDSFRIIHGIDEREKRIGFIGRFSEEKGVLNFLRAIPEILEISPDLEFFVAGEGSLKDDMEKWVNMNSEVADKIELHSWIPHDDLPGHLNSLSLLIIPSYTEGLPNILLEAMACGTPVLASAVGAIPEIIEDGKNGFIMRDNTPECIVKNIIRALETEGKEQIVRNAAEYVGKEFQFNNLVEKWREILIARKN